MAVSPVISVKLPIITVKLGPRCCSGSPKCLMLSLHKQERGTEGFGDEGTVSPIDNDLYN